MICLYVEKRPGFRGQADALLRDIRDVLGITGVAEVRVLQRYLTSDLRPEVLAEARTAAYRDIGAVGTSPGGGPAL